jgi:predicted RNase H-like HicB family nuclease/predicted RNA binding protein YcfA (HicA-like mRNA interferase family)
MKSREIISTLQGAGWVQVAQKGSHVQFKHPTKKGRVTVPHPGRDTEKHREAVRPEAEVRAMHNYIGLIHKDADSDFGVSFPDFPGVITAGVTLDDARAMAEEALALHIEGLVEDGEAIPEPSALEEVMSDPDNRAGVAILVSMKSEQPRAVRVNVTLPGDVLEQIDKYAEAQGYTRSGLLTQAAKKLMAEAA